MTLVIIASYRHFVLAHPTNEHLVKKIVHCFIGHERAETEYYETGKLKS